MLQTSNISTLYSFRTEFSPDSVEWCCHNPYENVFVCANYELKESCDINGRGSNRIGKILLFSVSAENGLKLHQQLNTAGVLDQKWCPNKISNTILLGVAISSKKVEIYKFCEDVHLKLVTFCEIKDDIEILILSIDWSTSLNKHDEPDILCSDSVGNIHLMKLIQNNLILQETFHGHKFEAWIAGFYYWDTNIFFSGGDDGAFLQFDKRMGSQPIVKNRRHMAGVTSLHSNLAKEYTLVTGSYDETLRLWDIRNIKNEIISLKVPGPLWRLKWNPFYEDYLLAACMLNGAHIINVNGIEEMKVTGSFYGHKSICYGIDWSHLKYEDCKSFGYDATAIIASCSFYDHLLCISKVH